MEDKTMHCVMYDSVAKKYATGIEWLVKNGIEYTIKPSIGSNQVVFRLKPKQIRAMAAECGFSGPIVVM